MVKHQQDANSARIILRPNRSASWRQTRALICALGGLSLCIALAWALAGAWMILPFAGAEVLILAIVMYRVSKATYCEEVIIFEGDSTYLYKKDNSHSHSPSSEDARVIQPRKESSIVVKQFKKRNDELQIFLKHGNKELELGHFLNHDEKRELVKLLKYYLLVRHSRPNSVCISA